MLTRLTLAPKDPHGQSEQVGLVSSEDGSGHDM